MTVRVLYFAALRDLVGLKEEQLELAESASLADLLALLGDRHPALAGWLPRVRVARNEAFAERETLVQDQDVVALIPPVAGG